MHEYFYYIIWTWLQICVRWWPSGATK